MENAEIINRITSIISKHGCFSIGELDGENQSILVGSLGPYVGLTEGFTEGYVEVGVYQTNSYSSDAIDTYEESYWLLNENVLGDILLLCEQWEAESLKTEKRISN